MAITPIEARCRACRNELLLSEIVELGTGECPRCRRPISPDWTPLLLAESRQTDQLLTHLIRSLHRLVNLPGNLELIPYSVLRNLFEEVGWDKVLADEPELLRGQLRLVRDEIDAWAQLSPEVGQPGAEGVTRALHSLANSLRAAARLRQEGATDANRGVVARDAEATGEAADHLDAAARNVMSGDADSDEVHRELDAAEAAIDGAATPGDQVKIARN